jgi:hypothetical protein
VNSASKLALAVEKDDGGRVGRNIISLENNHAVQNQFEI